MRRSTWQALAVAIVVTVVATACSDTPAKAREARGEQAAAPSAREGAPALPPAIADAAFEAWSTTDDPARAAELRAKPGFDARRYFAASPLDLDGNGTPESLVVRTASDSLAEPLCTTQNCPFWIYRVDGGRQASILGDLAGYVDGVTVLGSRTNGWADVQVQQHASAADRDVVVYTFDGTRYQPARCSTDTYGEDARGQVIVEKHTARPCPLGDNDFPLAGLIDGMALTAVQATLGPPLTTRRSANELGGGEFVTLVYKGLEVFAADGQHVSEVTVTTPAYPTTRGLRVGDAESRLTALYGEPTGSLDDVRDYTDPRNESHVLRVVVKKGRVTTITLGWTVD